MKGRIAGDARWCTHAEVAIDHAFAISFRHDINDKVPVLPRALYDSMTYEIAIRSPDTMSTAQLQIDHQAYESELVEGTAGNPGVDIRTLRARTGAVTYDPGLANTAACRSAITYIDGKNSELLYRGYPISQLATNCTFPEVCYLLLYGELPNRGQKQQFSVDLTYHTLLHEDMKKFFEGFPASAHPMAILSSMISSLSAYYPETGERNEAELNTRRLLAKAKTIAAFAYKKSLGQPFVYPRNDLSYAANLLHMLFAVPSEPYEVLPVSEKALDMLLILHADHEQNCSTSTVRAVASSQANLYASISAGVNALWGPLHGGANQAVVEMLEQIHADGGHHQKYVDKAKDRDDPFRLMGFGHRVYKSYDPRAHIVKETCDRLLDDLGIDDPLLELARKLEETALRDDFFTERGLYPNVDFYSGVMYRALGIPTVMFPLMFALGRLPGWISHFRELREDAESRIWRPRQIYTGPHRREFVPIEQRP
ncbi:citrate synthase [Nitrococcus mobilis Nb-231]|uniref:Citrate synthase n=2 Tax=Nitrococcus mobilis TaxID=35797 RepID=A4BVD6_9GAMM|nr:citrate synthase [Nitrococcus mobilis Nb-231]